MKNLDPDIRRFLLVSISDTFAEIRKFVEYREYNRDKVKQGILELCATLNIDLVEEEEEKKPVLKKKKKRLCAQCKRVSILPRLWSTGQRFCALCRWEERLKNEKAKLNHHGWTEIGENAEKDFTP